MEKDISLYKRNYWLLALEGAFFMGATGFYNSSTVIPVYIDSIMHSKQLVGLTLTLGSVFMYAFRLVVGPFVPHIKNHVRFTAVFMSLTRPLLLIPAVFVFAGMDRASVVALILAYAAFWICDGIVVPTWSEVLSNTVDPSRHGRLLGWQMLLGGVAGIGAGILINVFLSNPLLDFRIAYGWIFLIGGICAALSCVMMSCARNAPKPYKTGKVEIAAYFRELPGYFKREPKFTKMMAVQFLFLAASMCNPFIILFSGDALNIPQNTLAKLILVQSVGAPIGGWLWGFICDKLGPHNGIRLVGFNILLPPALSLLALASGGIPPMYLMIPVLLLIGICGGTWTCYYIYTLHAVQPESRPACIVLTSIITLPTAFASYAAGYITEKLGYPFLFVLCIALAGAGMFLAMRLMPARESGK